ncbi:MAG TPA: hypothetical protein VFL91_08235 [Thermomicrobiales bacterium]|nr:hypothetical protein [Thermomicrobiales bacterium]
MSDPTLLIAAALGGAWGGALAHVWRRPARPARGATPARDVVARVRRALGARRRGRT